MTSLSPLLLQEIPGDVAGLSRLRRLDVSYNLIETLDACLLERLADRLHYLNVRQNRFHCDAGCSLQARLRRVYFRLVKRWVLRRRAGGGHGHGGAFQKDRADGGRPPTTSPFVAGECWTPVEMRGSSVIDWKCRGRNAAARVALPLPARCNDIPS